MADITTTLDYYENLLIIQYAEKPKAKATARLLTETILADGIFLDVRDGYNLQNAVGVQLDTIGAWVGIDRFYTSNEFTSDYFGFADAVTLSPSANIVGFDDAAAPDKSGFFLDAEEVISTQLQLNDASYRTLIELKIVQNNSNHSFGDISTKLYQFFGDTLRVKDNYDMSITYFIGDTSSSLLRAALQKNVLPKPAGVRLELLDGSEFFGLADASNLSSINAYQVGFNDATVGFTKSGGFLNASTDIIS